MDLTSVTLIVLFLSVAAVLWFYVGDRSSRFYAAFFLVFMSSGFLMTMVENEIVQRILGAVLFAALMASVPIYLWLEKKDERDAKRAIKEKDARPQD